MSGGHTQAVVDRIGPHANRTGRAAPHATPRNVANVTRWALRSDSVVAREDDFARIKARPVVVRAGGAW